MKISGDLDRVLIEHIESNNSLESDLFFDFIFPIEIRSRAHSIVGKPVQLVFDFFSDLKL